MEPLRYAVLAVGLFALTFLSPGPNLLVVVQSSLSAGRSAGVAAAFGVAAGDGIYAALGLFGMATLITQSGTVFHAIKVIGGLYLIWCSFRLLRPHPSTKIASSEPAPQERFGSYFRRGLMTDLANPQTVLFFASIFAVTLRPDTPMWAKALSWFGIVTASVLWRVLLSFSFSQARIRQAYGRAQRAVERIAGVALGAFGVRLVIDGISPE